MLNPACRRVSILVLLALAGGSAADPPVTHRVQVSESTIVVKGRTAPIFRAVTNGGATVLRARRGEPLRIELSNRSTLQISMHPHGLILPNRFDGVPYITQLPVESGATYVYDFVPTQSGTYFFHSHFGWELQSQLAMPIILSDTEDGPPDVVVMITDFIFDSAPKVFAALRAKSGDSDESTKPMKPMKPMPGAAPDLNDVTYDALLANGRPITDPEVVPIAPGSTVRLRLINASCASNVVVSLGGIEGQLIAVDGEGVEPLTVTTVELGIAQRIDVMLPIAAQATAIPILAQAEGTKLLAGVVLASRMTTPPSLPTEALTASGAIGVGYRQERSLKPTRPLAKRPIDRSLDVSLDGTMNGYVWSLAGTAWPDGPPLQVREGERIELVFRNLTMMSHPMHLHGHRFQVTEIDGVAIDGAVRDTVLVMPKSTVKVQFDADNPGLWMVHCHITWHEAAGMLAVVEYEGFPKPKWYKEKDTFAMPSSLPVSAP